MYELPDLNRCYLFDILFDLFGVGCACVPLFIGVSMLIMSCDSLWFVDCASCWLAGRCRSSIWTWWLYLLLLRTSVWLNSYFIECYLVLICRWLNVLVFLCDDEWPSTVLILVLLK